MPTVAFLGLGAIGHPMAACLAKTPDITLSVWNRTASKAAAFASEFAVTHAATPADAARGADVVFTCLAVSADVASLLDGPDGLLSAMGKGSVLVDCTSGDPATSKVIAARLAEIGAGFLDAPVSGGVKGAETASLTVMVGGEQATLAFVQPVVEAFAKKIVHCGPVGSGDAVKAGNQALLAIHVWSTGEVLMALAKAGVKPDLALDVINGSSGRSNTSENLFPERVIGRAFPRTFKLALLDKDIGIAADISAENDVPTPLIDLAAELIGQAHQELGEEADHVEAVRVIEERAGVTIV